MKTLMRMLILWVIAGNVAWAQPAPEHTWGVCIGISAYDDANLTLKWSDTDATEFCKTFLKFTLNVPEDQYLIVKNEDATHDGILNAFGWVAMRAKPGDRVYLFYSGHGGDRDLFIPYDSANPLTLDEIRAALGKIDADEVLMFTDACLSGRLVGKRVKAATAKGGGGWSKDVTVKLARTTNAASGVVIMTSSNGQQDSLELANLKNSLFTYFLMNALMKPAQADADGDGRVTMAELYRMVYQLVTAEAEQQPQLSDEGAAQNVVVLAYTQPQPSEGSTCWENATPGATCTEETTGMEFVWIPSGSFQMGCSPQDGDCRDDEKPAHRVTLDGFWMGRTEVTQAQWETVMGNNPSNFKGADRPVEMVSWNDAQMFLKQLNATVGAGSPRPSQGAATAPLQFRLPTEAEWEYAARAGTQTAYSFGNEAAQLGDYAWYWENASEETHPVGQKQPNQWGLYDMHGNVWEWVADTWYDNYNGAPTDGSVWGNLGDGKLKMLRGGSWSSLAIFTRSSSRYTFVPAFQGNLLGWRVVVGAR